MDSGVFDHLTKIGYFGDDWNHPSIYWVNINWLSADSIAEMANSFLRMIIAGYGLYITITMLFLSSDSGTIIIWDQLLLYTIFISIILSLAVDAYAMLYASLNLSMYMVGTEQYQFVKYNTIYEFLPLDGKETDYAGLVQWCIEAVLGPKKVTWVFDLFFLVAYVYIGYYELSFFYIPAAIIGFLGDIVLFNIFPMLDMPYVPWGSIINSWENGEAFNGGSQNNLSLNNEGGSTNVVVVSV